MKIKKRIGYLSNQKMYLSFFLEKTCVIGSLSAIQMFSKVPKMNVSGCNKQTACVQNLKSSF